MKNTYKKKKTWCEFSLQYFATQDKPKKKTDEKKNERKKTSKR